MSQVISGPVAQEVRGSTVVLGTRPEPDAAVRRGQAEMLSLTFAVCTAIFVTKVLIAYRDLDNADAPPQIADASWLASLVRVWACSAEDFAVGAGCLLALAIGLGRLKWGATRFVLRFVAHLAAAAALCYLIINAQIFHAVRHFLTYGLLQIAGGFQWDRSVSTYVTPPFKLTLALVPLLTLTVHLWLVWAFPGPWLTLADRLCRPIVLLVAVLVLGSVSVTARHGLVASEPCDYLRNPHLHFARSVLRGLFAANPAAVDDEEVPELLPGRPGHSSSLLAHRPSNIILITAESVGARYLQVYGCRMATTPHLRRLEEAGRSLTFDSFYATANHSIASALPIFGGLYNDPTTLATVIDHPEFPVPAAPAWLQRQGYVTCFFSSGGRTWESYRNMVPAFVGQGFDVARDPRHPFWQAAPKPDAFLDDDHFDEAMFADVRRAVRTFRDRNFAIWAWTYDAHNPYYDGPGPRLFPREHFPCAVAGHGDKEAQFQTYLRAIWRLDSLIGGLCNELDELGLADETLIVLTGDHGEEFGEHGCFGHNWSVYEEEIRVPCVLICPRLGPLGRRSAVVGSHVDLWATITDICGLPADPRWQGRSLVSGGPTGRRAYFYRATAEVGVREGKYKYVWDYEQNLQRLYDLSADPSERHNVAAANPGVCAALDFRVKAWVAFQSRLTKERLGSADIGCQRKNGSNSE
jgi:arylsulfatase A-like enzyme